jgi:acyl dehydratase
MKQTATLFLFLISILALNAQNGNSTCSNAVQICFENPITYPGTINAGQSWSYNLPARPGDVIRLEARALDKFIKKDRLFVIHDNVFFNQNNEVICSGRGWTIRPA